MENAKHVFNPLLYEISLGEYEGKEVIWLKFPYEQELITMLRQNVKARWSSKNKAWHIPDSQQNRILCNLTPKNIGKQALSKIHPTNLPAFTDYQNQLTLRGFLGRGISRNILGWCSTFSK